MGGQLPPEWQAAVAKRLEPGEEPLAWFEPDLDDALRYARGLVVLTDRRLLASEVGGERWRVWPLAVCMSLRNIEQGSAGTLELVGTDSRLARWQYTAGRAAAARRLTQRLADLQAGGDARAGPVAFCPSCGSAMTGAGRCDVCEAAPVAPSASSLLRLAEFARHRVALILLGFLLTLAATVASLVPPYLTMPL